MAEPTYGRRPVTEGAPSNKRVKLAAVLFEVELRLCTRIHLWSG